MSSDHAWGDEVYQPDGGNDQAEEQQLGAEDTLMDGVPDPLDEGYSPPDRLRRRTDNTLDSRLAAELPEPSGAEDDGAGLGDAADTDGELRDGEVGSARAGRLAMSVSAEEDDELGRDLFARDCGVDGAGASAEEAAMHVIEDEE